MILKPQKIEKIKGTLLKTYLIEEEPNPKEIQVLFFDEVKTSSYTSQSEFMTRRAAMQEIEDFTYFVDSVEIWKFKGGGTTIQIGLMGERGKRNCLKLLRYLIDKYSISLENITLGFFDPKFISQLKL